MTLADILADYRNALFLAQNELNWVEAQSRWPKPPDGIDLKLAYQRGKCAEIQNSIDILLGRKEDSKTK